MGVKRTSLGCFAMSAFDPKRTSHLHSAGTPVGSRNSPRDCRITVVAPCIASPAMIAATTTSGQPVPVPNTPAAANNTARLPSTSLRVQIHAERMLASPSRKAQSKPKDAALAASASETNRSHCEGARQGAMQGVPDNCANNP